MNIKKCNHGMLGSFKKYKDLNSYHLKANSYFFNIMVYLWMLYILNWKIQQKLGKDIASLKKNLIRDDPFSFNLNNRIYLEKIYPLRVAPYCVESLCITEVNFRPKQRL